MNILVYEANNVIRDVDATPGVAVTMGEAVDVVAPTVMVAAVDMVMVVAEAQIAIYMLNMMCTPSYHRMLR